MQRKTVTVLFCDVVGSTSLGESVDPEALRSVLARYFERMEAIVEGHGGTVEKFIGDAVMAVFGVPVIHEDDALRALRAAAEMREAFPELGIEGRIGVTTGEVVTGTEERLATGDAVNVAARLEQAAQPGEILIGEATRRLARDAAEVEPVEPLELKGKSAPLAAFRLLSVREGAPAFDRRLDAPMVGRERERQLLRQAFDRAVEESTCYLFTVLGPAGIGKSRLVGELLDSIEGEATVVSARCLSYGEGITYWPLLAVLEQLDRHLEISAPEETAWAARKLLEETAAERPLVVLFDDLQWAEPTFLDLIEHVADLSRDAPILLLCVARRELLDARPAWGGGKLNATTILLEPLGSEEVAVLIDNLATELGEQARAKIVEAAEGNPLFVEEMLAMLGENGDAPEVPPTIQALLAARLDRLDPPERDVLGRASVEGKVFHVGAVSTLAPQDARGEVKGCLLTLVRKELIRPDRPEFAGEDAFRFRHLLIRDAAYQSLPKQERADLHERFADWLEAVAGSAAEYLAIVGYHLEQAYRYRLELGSADERAAAIGRRGGGFLAAAGEAARSSGDMAGAASLLGRAVEILPGGPDRLRLLVDLGDALMWCGELTAADRVLVEAVAAAETAGDEKVRLEARLLHALLQIHVDPEGRTELARTEVEQALPVLERIGDDRALARAWRLLAMTDNMASQYERQAESSRRAAAHARSAGDRREEAEAQRWLIAAVSLGPVPVAEAIEICERVMADAVGAPRVQSSGLLHLSYLYARVGRFDEARRALAEGKRITEESGTKLVSAAWAMFDGFIERLAGTSANAIEPMREGCRILEEMGEKSFRSTVLAVLAQNLYELGEYDEAEETTRRSEEAAAADDVISQVLWRCVRGACLARRGLLEEGEQLAREAVTLAGRCDSPDQRGDALMMLGEVLRLAGRGDEARARLEEADRIYAAKGYTPEVNPARKLLVS